MAKIIKYSGYICPVCGYDKLLSPPYTKEYKEPSYEICSCCGFEYGFDDDDRGYTFESYREEWIKKGYPFFNENEKPENWDGEIAKSQLENLKK